MSHAVSRRARWAVRTATAAGTAVLLAVPTAASAAELPAPPTPWLSVSDVLAATLERASAPPAPEPAPVAKKPAAEPKPAPKPRILATVEGVEIVEPSTRMAAIGFHEGSSRGLPLTPVGKLRSNQTRMNAPEDRKGPEYHLMPSRGRSAGASSAVDLAMPKNEPVLAVATGTVRSVSPYSLYGTTPDLLIEITPAGRPGLNVQVFHVRDAKVAPGDKVVAGETVLAAKPRQLPFPSQVDRYVGHAGPHVHVQVLEGA